MSGPNRPSFQKATKSSSAAVPARWSTYSAGVSPVRGLSPVRGSFLGARQDIDGSRSHTNPLFTSRTTDTSRTVTPAKTTKENRDKQDAWKVPVEKAQYSGKTLCTTPGKCTKNVAAMRFTTPPKPVVKRKILAENREYIMAPPRPEEGFQHSTAGPSTEADVQALSEEGLSSRQSTADNGTHKRTKCSQDDGNSAEVAVPLSPAQCAESIRRLSLAISEESSLSGVEDVPPYPELFAAYSPRPEFLRAKKSPSPAKVKENASSVSEDDSVCPERTTPTYDPKHNFLSPRPQFLRYRPLRRLEILRRSAEGMLGDFDMESPALLDDSSKDSLGTDGDSSKDSLGADGDSSKDYEKEDNESQDASQEIQSLKISSECPLPTASMLEEESGVTVQTQTDETIGNCLSSSQRHAQVEMAEEIQSARADVEVEVDEEEDWLDDIERGSSVSSTILSLVSLLVIVSLVLVASGSPALLPSCLHHNDISDLWKTSKVAAPVRGLIRSAEGLWEVNPSLSDYTSALPDPRVVQLAFVHAITLVQSVELGQVAITGKNVWSSGVRYIMDSYTEMTGSKVEEMDEFNWVPDYDFVVARDMFDPAVFHRNIITWTKSKLSSLLPKSARLAENHGQEERNTHSGINTTYSANPSTCAVIPRVSNDYEIQTTGPFAPITDVVSVISIPGHDHGSHDDKYTENFIYTSIGGDSSLWMSTLGMEDDGELPTSISLQKILPFDNTGRETPWEEICVQDFASNVEEAANLNEEAVLEGTNNVVADLAVCSSLLHTLDADITLNIPVERLDNDVELAATAQEQDLPRDGNVVASGDETGEFHATGASECLHSSPEEMIDSSFLQKARHLQSAPTVAAAGIAVLLLAGAAMLAALSRTNVRAGKARPAVVNGRQYGFYHSPRKSQNSLLEPEAVDDHSWSLEDLPAPEFDTQESLLEKVSDKDPLGTPERPFKFAANDRNMFESPDMEILEDSSLGRFTALLPVVHNEGTEHQQVKLTPVRRSSRIRTRMQSPCNSMYSHYLFSC